MTPWNLHHLAFNRGWRPRLTSVTTPTNVEPNTREVLQPMNLEGIDDDANVVAGWLMAASLTTTSDQLEVRSVESPPGEERQQARRSVEQLIDAGATDVAPGFLWAGKQNVDGTTVYNIHYNGWGGIPSQLRFPSLSHIEAFNPTSVTIPITGYEVQSILVHDPKLFFRQMRAFNALTGLIDPEIVPLADRDDVSEDELIETLKEPSG